MHIDGSHRGISKLDLSVVFATDEERAALGHVRSLDLSFNELAELQDLQPLAHLLILDASHNSIRHLGGMPLSLTKLCCSDNLLTSVDGLAGLSSLTFLDVSNNRLSSLGLSNFHVPESLLHLNVASNQLNTLAGIERFTRLEQLNAADNTLRPGTADATRLPGPSEADRLVRHLLPLTQLKHLHLNGNAPLEAAGSTFLRRLERALTHALPTLVQYNGVSVALGTEKPRARASSAGPASVLDVSSVSSASGNRSKRDASSITKHKDFSLSEPRIQPPDDRASLQLSMAQRLLLRERQDNDVVQRRCQQLERDVADAKRTISQQLITIASLREAASSLEQDNARLCAKVDKLQRDAKYAAQTLAMERRKRAEEVETLRLQHEQGTLRLQQSIDVQVSSMRKAALREAHARIAALEHTNLSLTSALSRFQAAASVHNHESSVPCLPDTSATKHDSSSVSSQDASTEQGRSRGVHDAGATDFAMQLKRWVVAEVSKRPPANGSPIQVGHR